jgi:hypothetical protein
MRIEADMHPTEPSCHSNPTHLPLQYERPICSPTHTGGVQSSGYVGFTFAVLLRTCMARLSPGSGAAVAAALSLWMRSGGALAADLAAAARACVAAAAAAVARSQSYTDDALHGICGVADCY